MTDKPDKTPQTRTPDALTRIDLRPEHIRRREHDELDDRPLRYNRVPFPLSLKRLIRGL